MTSNPSSIMPEPGLNDAIASPALVGVANQSTAVAPTAVAPTAMPIGVSCPPTQAELPYDDNEPMESERHKLQMELLIEGAQTWLKTQELGYVGGNMFVYFSLAQVRNRDFKGPDFFVVLGVPKGERRSWVSWEEGKAPDVVIELLSESTAEVDKTLKKQIYQDRMRASEYFWYDPFEPEDWAGFRLQGGQYQAIAPNPQGNLRCQAMDLLLVRWQGSYKGIEATWLRWADSAGDLLPTHEERATAAQQQAAAAQQQASEAQQALAAERQRSQALAAKLRELGVEPGNL